MYINFTCTYTCYYSAGDIDYNSVSSDLILSPTAPERCVSVNVVDDKAVELSESLTISLSLTGELNVQITKENITVLIYDDDGETSCSLL